MLMATLWLTAPAARAQEAALFADDRWIPSLAITSGAIWGRQHATVSSDCRVPGSEAPTSCDPAEPDYGSVLREGDSDDERIVTPYVGGNLSLMAPAFPVLGRPRLFAGVELPYQFGIDRNVAQKQRPTGLREPDNPGVTEALDETSLLGQGSRTRSEVQGLTFGANAGVSFAFEAFRRQFRFRSAVNYLRMEIDLRGRVESPLCVNNHPSDATRDTCDLDGIQFTGTDGFTRIVTLKAHDAQWFDGVGPSFDLEMDTGRFGPYLLSLFLTGGGYYVFSDRDMALSTTSTIGPDTLGDPVDYHADFTFRVNPWLFRAGLGLRFSWVGYD